MKKFTFSLLLLYLFIPLSVFAYSDYIIASGESIGIELKADHVLIVGSYDIGTHNILKDTDLKIGDEISVRMSDGTIKSAVSQIDEATI